MRLHIPTSLLLACFLFSLGCSKTAPGEAAPDGKEKTTNVSSGPKKTPVELKLQSVDETDQLIASFKGKVVVIDLWALT